MSFLSQGTSKAGVNHEREAGKRRDVALTLRKQKKDELLREKRQRQTEPAGEPEEWRVQLSDLPSYKQQMESGVLEQQFLGTKAIRMLLSANVDLPPINEVIQEGCIPILFQFLRADQHPDLQFEALWALTNVASGTAMHTQIILELGCVAEFVRLLGSPKENVHEQAVWAIGNLAGEGAKVRELVLQAGALPEVLKIVHHTNPSLETLRNVAWCLSNFMRFKPTPQLDQVKAALPTMVQMLHHEDKDIVVDACWGLSYLTDGPDERIAATLAAGAPNGLDVAKRIVQLLADPDYAVHAPSLRLVGNIVTGLADQTQAMIDNGCIEVLKQHLHSPAKNIRKECCWALSNIAAGTEAQRQHLLACDVLPIVMKEMREAEAEVRKEACYVVVNIIMQQHPEEIVAVVQAGAIEAFIDLLPGGMSAQQDMRNKLAEEVLDGLGAILEVGEEFQSRVPEQFNDQFKERITACGGLDKLSNLQAHRDKKIYEKAENLLKNYFEDAQDAEDMNEFEGIDAAGGGDVQFNL